MTCSNKINTFELGVISTFFSLVGSALSFIVAIILLKEEIAKKNSAKEAIKQQIQDLNEQLDVLERKKG